MFQVLASARPSTLSAESFSVSLVYGKPYAYIRWWRRGCQRNVYTSSSGTTEQGRKTRGALRNLVSLSFQCYMDWQILLPPNARTSIRRNHPTIVFFHKSWATFISSAWCVLMVWFSFHVFLISSLNVGPRKALSIPGGPIGYYCIHDAAPALV